MQVVIAERAAKEALRRRDTETGDSAPVSMGVLKLFHDSAKYSQDRMVDMNGLHNNGLLIVMGALQRQSAVPSMQPQLMQHQYMSPQSMQQQYMSPQSMQQQYMQQQYMQQQYMPSQSMQQQYVPPQSMQQQYMPSQSMQQQYVPPQSMQQQYMPPQYMQQQYMPPQSMQQQYIPQQYMQQSYMQPAPAHVAQPVQTETCLKKRPLEMEADSSASD